MYNGVSLMLENEWSAPDVCIESDSCLTGGGACMTQLYCHIEFPMWVRELCSSINQLECVVLTIAVKKWGACSQGKSCK